MPPPTTPPKLHNFRPQGGAPPLESLPTQIKRNTRDVRNIVNEMVQHGRANARNPKVVAESMDAAKKALEVIEKLIGVGASDAGGQTTAIVQPKFVIEFRDAPTKSAESERDGVAVRADAQETGRATH